MPEEFGTYQLHRKIAQGGMAEVFEARALGEIGGFSRPVAIKRMFPHLVDRDDIITMFIDEARIASRLLHPNIVQIYDLGVVDGAFYLAMELVEGLDLRRVCELGVKQDFFLPRELAVRIIADVASGLHYAHTRCDDQGRPMRVVHRDISPQNVLLSVQGGVKICDFGIAKAESRLTHTRTGEFKGKFSYMSPEQFDGGALDHRSDIFTLGIVLYEITTVSRLFRSRTEYETMRKITEGVVTRPSEVRADYPEELEAIVLRALARDPEDRFQSAGELAEALEDWLFERRVRVGSRQLAEYFRELERRAQEPTEPGDDGGEDATRPVTISEQHFVLGDDDLEVLEDVDVLEERTRASSIDVTTLEIGEGARREAFGEPGGVPVVEVRRVEARASAAHAYAEAEGASIDETLVDVRVDDDVTGGMQARGEGLDERDAWLSLSDGERDVSGEEALERVPESADASTSSAAPSTRTSAGNDDSFWRKIPELDVASSSGPSPWAPPVPSIAATAAMPTIEADRAGGSRPILLWAGLGALILLAGLAALLWSGGNGSEALEEAPALRDQPRQMATLSIVTEPPGARVIADGVRLDGATPLQAQLEAGPTHDLWVVAEGYRPVRLEARAGTPLAPVVLERSVGGARAPLSFESTPSGAAIYLNGERVGVTPLRLENVVADGLSHVQFELAGHKAHVSWVQPSPEQHHRIEGMLASQEATRAIVRVSSRPRSSRVMLDGASIGTTPLEEVVAAAGFGRVEISAHERRAQAFVLDFNAVGSVHIDTALSPLETGQGTLSLSVSPAAAIYIEGRSFGAGPIKELELEAGSHTLVFETIEGRRLRASVDIEADAHLAIDATLQGDKIDLRPR
ncbi:PEGA domain-containing protein [Lujinxingia sediminis]|uniref:PEGA domain-containing protein n=1 Tax=Lujinxingia sediminis TaxID=2480984 RepID=A0ABY0CVM4_9DELT|nr:serine/threonine-protein kinase [Lujinxingia sediminis]RVU47882.1 PEGA domain-containing protein [Lujinxingia sediminis]